MNEPSLISSAQVRSRRARRWLSVLAVGLLGCVAAQAQDEDAPRKAALAAPVFLPGPSKASAATKASSPAKWGLSPADLSLVDDFALQQKADAFRRKAELQRAAEAGDAFAQLLVGLEGRSPFHPEQKDSPSQRWLEKAAAQGLVRAAAVAEAAASIVPGQEAVPSIQRLCKLADTGSAYATYHCGMALNIHGLAGYNTQDEKTGRSLMFAAALAGYAPAQAKVGKDLLKFSSEEMRAMGRDFLQKAAANGDSDARRTLAELKQAGKP